MNIALFLAAFLASGVEMVEAATIVLAMGVTRGWRSSLLGALVAVVALGILVAIFGPALLAFPLRVLRIVIGALLFAFGGKWLYKAILRASGRKSKHDEDAIFASGVASAKAVPREESSIDGYGFTVSFKGVFLEGVEVVFIVLTLGANKQDIWTPAAAAFAALIVVVVAALLARRPLARVPENQMKFGVGLLATSFGTFWFGEGVGIAWPGGDAALVWLVAIYLALAVAGVVALRRDHEIDSSE
jgi:uncharacterized membrane protein